MTSQKDIERINKVDVLASMARCASIVLETFTQLCGSICSE
jgi:hypothetical protein